MNHANYAERLDDCLDPKYKDQYGILLSQVDAKNDFSSILALRRQRLVSLGIKKKDGK